RGGYLFLALVLLLAPAPAGGWIWAGLAAIALGLTMRALAAATLVKIKGLTTHGIYQATRNPLYVGNSLIGVGFACFGGSWGWLVACLILFGLVYRGLILAEEAFLLERHPDSYPAYVASVPRFLPNPLKFTALPGTLSAESLAKNREAKNLLGTMTGLALLLAKSLILRPGQYWWG
ncbi:MAG TPA: isoprenylcysteine carboxylmethyltransferase family protein, partial [bacterium]|nr:isoprenylcysteine carboxylmethyltransferase family protein [bacterium]